MSRLRVLWLVGAAIVSAVGGYAQGRKDMGKTADSGSQYRSLILYRNEEQREEAEKSKRQAQKRFARPIVTEIKSLTAFYRAEDYHQGYYEKNPYAGYCSFVIRPKLQKLGLE